MYINFHIATDASLYPDDDNIMLPYFGHMLLTRDVRTKNSNGTCTEHKRAADSFTQLKTLKLSGTATLHHLIIEAKPPYTSCVRVHIYTFDR